MIHFVKGSNIHKKENISTITTSRKYVLQLAMVEHKSIFMSAQKEREKYQITFEVNININICSQDKEGECYSCQTFSIERPHLH